MLSIKLEVKKTKNEPFYPAGSNVKNWPAGVYMDDTGCIVIKSSNGSFPIFINGANTHMWPLDEEANVSDGYTYGDHSFKRVAPGTVLNISINCDDVKGY